MEQLQQIVGSIINNELDKASEMLNQHMDEKLISVIDDQVKEYSSNILGSV